VSRLSPGGATVSPSRYRHCWWGNFRRWIAGKRYILQQKSPRKDTSVGCPLGDGKSVGVAKRFPWRVGWAQTGYPKKRGFRQIRSLNGNFSGIWNHVSRDTTWTRVHGKFGGNRSKESGISGAWLTWQKNNAYATLFSRSLRNTNFIFIFTQ